MKRATLRWPVLLRHAFAWWALHGGELSRSATLRSLLAVVTFLERVRLVTTRCLSQRVSYTSAIFGRVCPSSKGWLWIVQIPSAPSVCLIRRRCCAFFLFRVPLANTQMTSESWALFEDETKYNKPFVHGLDSIISRSSVVCTKKAVLMRPFNSSAPL
jgi:hypothetical protein